MEKPEPQYVVTPWRYPEELYRVRDDLYSSDLKRKKRGLAMIDAWRYRKSGKLPLLLESTADIVAVVVEELKGLEGGALRMAYAGALARFLTGLHDTSSSLLHSPPILHSQHSSSSPNQPPAAPEPLTLPTPLFELRHRIVHRHLPSLAQLQRGAKESLEWLWAWYWGLLGPVETVGRYEGDGDGRRGGMNVAREGDREAVGAILKTYIKSRKSEIKSHLPPPQHSAAATALAALQHRLSSISPDAARHMQDALLHVLVWQRVLFPAGRRVGGSMEGAFMLWDGVLVAVCSAEPPILNVEALIHTMLDAMITAGTNTSSLSNTTQSSTNDAIAEAHALFSLHILTHSSWSAVHTRDADAFQSLLQSVLERSFVDAGRWSLEVADSVITAKGEELRYSEQWRSVLDAARGKEEEEGDMTGEYDGGEGHDGMGGEEQKQGNEQGPQDKHEHAAAEAEQQQDTAKHNNEVEQQHLPTPPSQPKQKRQGPRKVVGYWTPRPIGWMPPGQEYILDD